MRLADKVTIITGAGGGIGSGLVRRFAESGAKLCLTDYNLEAVERLCDRLALPDDQALLLRHDVADAASWEEVVRRTCERFGRLDVLVNNAGVAARTGQPYDAIEFEDWRRVMSVNLDGVFLGMSAAARAMHRTGGGSIVNIGSTAGLSGTNGGAAYGTSKGALRTLTKQAAYSFAIHGYDIRVNIIHPGYVWTDFVRASASARYGSEEEALKVMTAEVPLGRMIEPDDIAWPAVYFASDKARNVTGSELIVDGGRRCRP
ncbi:SDR family NAD(P)-dependent oxidoreductase [Paracoccus versutus]|uniref:SDR family NAD(P)-dependent oxidoreductase n=1 Tax=Paracoccus versutus TaxID=34007 RepID=UPI000DF869D3|nr:glucose 1-dehydrogenase [Paracoccus versutus]RDD70311.1 SDR family NAD(P)-dependent oxidoreductase [Paracoccus versutus]